MYQSRTAPEHQEEKVMATKKTHSFNTDNKDTEIAKDFAYFDSAINSNGALAGVALWIEHRPMNQRFAGLIPSQGTCLDCRPGPQLGEGERHD